MDRKLQFNASVPPPNFTRMKVSSEAPQEVSQLMLQPALNIPPNELSAIEEIINKSFETVEESCNSVAAAVHDTLKEMSDMMFDEINKLRMALPTNQMLKKSLPKYNSKPVGIVGGIIAEKDMKKREKEVFGSSLGNTNGVLHIEISSEEEEAASVPAKKTRVSKRDMVVQILDSSSKPMHWMTRNCLLSYFNCIDCDTENLDPENDIRQEELVRKLLNKDCDDNDVKQKILHLLQK